MSDGAVIQFGMKVINDEAEKKLRRMGDDRLKMEKIILNRVGQGIVSYVQREKLRGQVLKRQSGFLAASIQHRVVGPHALRIGPGAIYGAAHEFGIPLSDGNRIFPKRGKALRFFVNGQLVFAKSVRQHVVKRPYLAPGITEYLNSGKGEREAERAIQDWIDKL